MSSLTSTPTIYLSPKEAAQRAGVSTRTLRRAIKARKLRGYKVGALVRIAEADLKAFVERTPAGAAGA